MDGRQVDHVEAHRGDGRQPLGGGAQGPADGGAPCGDDGALGAREEFVPRAEQGPAALDDQRHGARDGQQLAQRMAGEGLDDLRGERRGEPGGGGQLRIAQRVQGGQHRLPAVALGDVGGGPLVQRGALGEHQLGVDARRDLDRGVLAPGRERIGPRLDGEGPAALDVRGDVAAPPVGAGRPLLHRRPRTAAAGGIAQHHVGRDRVMAFAEDGGRDLEGLAHHGLRRAAAAIDLRADVQNRDATDHQLTWFVMLCWVLSFVSALRQGERVRGGALQSAFTRLADDTAGRGLPAEPSLGSCPENPAECELLVRNLGSAVTRPTYVRPCAGGRGAALTRSAFASSTRCEHSGVAVCGGPVSRRGPSAHPEPLSRRESVQERLRGWNRPYRETRR